jgi:hypothetical protein
VLHASLTPSPTPQREELRYVRFEHATEIIRGITYGPFTYVDEARDILVGSDRAELDDVMSWFNDNLEEPERMVPFRDVGERRARRRRRQEALAQCGSGRTRKLTSSKRANWS